MTLNIKQVITNIKKWIMAKYATLKAAIEAVVTTNGNYEISGEDMRETLKAIVDSLGANYQLVGFALPATDPGTPDQNVAYLAGPGTYPNFGPTTVDKGQIGLFKYNGTWSYETIDCGVSIEYEEYPGGDAFEWTFYDSDNPDGLTIKIAKTVSGLVNAPNVAISQWWAAQTERKLNVLGGYTISIDSLTTTPQSLGLLKIIQSGQIIDSITGANKLILGINGGGSVTVNASDLPYKATADLINVRTYSGTANNVSIVVRGINDIIPAYININEVANHPAAYANAAEALADVPVSYRRKGVKVVFLDSVSQYWIEMICIDDVGGANWWLDDNNWVIEGPIETELLSATGGQQLRIAGEKCGNLDDFLNVNVWNDTIYPYESKESARIAVSATKRKKGLYITYLLDEGWKTEQFIGDDITNWDVDANWKKIIDDELQLRVEEIEQILGTTTTERATKSLDITWAGTGAVIAVHNSTYPLGTIRANLTSIEYTDYVDLRNFANKSPMLTFFNCKSTSAQANVLTGLCFYDADKVAISGIPFYGDQQSSEGGEEKTVEIPANAAYVRFSCRQTVLNFFFAQVEYDKEVYTPGLRDDVVDLQDDVVDLQDDVVDLQDDVVALQNAISGESTIIHVIQGGYIDSDNGNVINNANYKNTDYVRINELDKFVLGVFQISVPQTIGLAFFDADKNYITGIHYPYLIPQGYNKENYIAPPNTRYVRFTVVGDVVSFEKVNQKPLAPTYPMYKSFNTKQQKGMFGIRLDFGNGIMIGSAGNDKVASNDNVVIYRSADWGLTWSRLGDATSVLGLREGLYYGAHDGNGNAIIGSGDLGEHYLLKIANYGANWPNDYTKILTATQIDALIGVETNGVENVIYCGNNTWRALCNSGSTNNAGIESTDGGTTWHLCSTANPLRASVRTIFKDSKGVIWACGMRGSIGVWKSADNGLNWERVSEFLAFQSIIEHKGNLFSGAMKSGATEAYIYRSRDNGQTWQKIFTFSGYSVNYHRTFISVQNALIAVFAQGEGGTSSYTAWFISLDGGDSWGEMGRENSYEAGYAYEAIQNGNLHYINTHSGLYLMYE